ncbi:MarR family winged helix-turn-helix transcriptional regulator [Anaerotignum faecicola]|nr:MarR family winged helix-turn-helix transcriptional regulator [Anaerotignum faecicola]
MSKIIPRNTPCYCINFRRAANTITKYYDNAFEKLNITTTQFSLLNNINILKTCNKSELAQFTKLDRTTVIRGLGILKKKKLIEEIDGHDNRNKNIRLTGAGEKTVADGMEEWKKAQERVKAVIGEENIPMLKEIFSKIETLDSKLL